MTGPLYRTLLLFDIERFSDRDDVEQAFLRRMLYDVVDRILQAAGIDRTRHLREDRGDGLLVVIDANVPVTGLLKVLLTEGPGQLHAMNRMASSAAQIRLRTVLATGFVTQDADGPVGTDVNLAFRLLDAEALREALRTATTDIALCVSESVHRGIVQHDHPGIPAASFHEITVHSKNGPLHAWLYGSPPTPATAPAEAAQAAAVPAPPGPAPSPSPALRPHGGLHFRGRNTGVVAQQITGSVFLGGGAGGADRGDQA
ncbi:hypothetical protein [Streptomyces antimicrobicus]|uniref:Guanylate cyclase domain-containing protein n=1 Tax=Streptomyces antimicrobicus TaxID=2883108 RepID=A0ABS8B218_9ACTN|nr:hypothetical protein [Streptomyces antimicrobicus]MCB5178650.1 hypothetical protein [Streptomyces antimicrobicus]